MHPPPTGPTNIPLPPVSSEVKSRGVHFPDSTPLTASPESYENPLPSEASCKVPGPSGVPNPLIQPTPDRVPAIDPRLRMIRRRSQCETRLSSLHSFRMTMGVPFPESSTFSQVNFTPSLNSFPVRSHFPTPCNWLLIVANRWGLVPVQCPVDLVWIALICTWRLLLL